MLPGHRLGPYEIVTLLGAGGMGEVWLAEDARLGRRVALKRPPAAAASPEAYAQLEREARAAARLNHPNIAAVYDVLDHEGELHIVMEYVEGETLSARLRGGPIAIEPAVDIGVQLADALAAAHDAGVVHRDLKPSNIAVTPTGRVKILDFGIAHVGPSGARAGTRGPAFGTPGYTAPEQMSGGPGDARSDIFGLGAVMYELLTGRPPLDPTSDPIAAQIAALAERPRSLRSLNPAVPTALDALVLRALARNPADRVPSAAQFKNELERIAIGLREQPTGPIEPPRRLTRALPRPVWVAVIVVLALAAGIGIPIQRQCGQPPQQRTPAVSAGPLLLVIPLDNFTGDSRKDYVGSGIADSLRIDLAQLPGLTVVTRALMRAEAGEPDPRRMARALGANFMLGGSLQAAGSRLRLNMTLLREDGTAAWTRGYEYDAESQLFDVQRRIAQDVAWEGLRMPLSAQDRQRLGAPRTASPAALAAYWRGQQLFDRADEPRATGEAIQALEEAVAADPAFALARAALAQAHWLRYQQTRDSADADRALAAAVAAQRVGAEEPQVWISLARVHQGTGRLDDAEKDLRQALQLDPASHEARRLLGQLYGARGRFEDAEREFRVAIARRPDYWQGYMDLGGFFYGRARFRDAIGPYTRAGELNPHSGRPFHNLASAYHQLGDTAHALENYRKAVAISPIASSFSGIGTIQFAEGKYEDAAASFRLAVQLQPGLPLHHGNLGDALRRLGRPAEAAESYARAVDASHAVLKVNPNDARTLMRLGVYEAKLGRPEAAEKDAARAVEISAGEPETLYRLATVLAINGKAEPALAALEAALKKGYGAAEAATDEDLASLRGSPRFRALVQTRPSSGVEKE
jgi:tetratricopeptide (TPR) repeat protein